MVRSTHYANRLTSVNCKFLADFRYKLHFSKYRLLYIELVDRLIE